ncbi:RNA 3'-terminal phosphate cyclase [Candidatus Woesearchaeota archaeon]|nr:RNA 3'-terminal phosphate cyclase [Candidatus Woesearchaeota archaeon]MCF7901727.1 RNA 3'-terminal phosphate cyclase [Candidatus Woesearchaeota archaeon]MCF8014077.1 RNA 3'-terminal phosphate cyclase [Candidatus Woesearchaeota archaeon]
MIEIDGSFEEGGGQILRTSIAMSLHTQKPFRITKIRSNRPKPGLSQQHLKCLELALKLSKSKCSGMHIGSEEIEFLPGKIKETKNIDFDIGTAGSITLLLQSIILPYILSERKIRLKITGGTDVNWSPPIDFYEKLLIPELRKITDIEISVLKRGYYPKGKGLVELKIKGTNRYQKINLTNTGSLKSIQGICHSSKSLQELKIADKITEATKIYLSELNTPLNIQESFSETQSEGISLFIYGIFEEKAFQNPEFYRISSNELWIKEKTPEEISENIYKKFQNQINKDPRVDEYLGDQLIPFLSILKGEIKVPEITKHMKSNIYVCEKFIKNKFEIKGQTISVS